MVGGVPGGVPGGVAGGVIGGIIGSVPSAAPPPPPPPPPVKVVEKPVTPQRIRVGGNVQAANLIRRPKPAYPPLAKQARIQGMVKLNAVIAKDGTIQDLKAVSGHPLLVPAALEAVRQWLYKPTLLNGEPVEVATIIDVNFTVEPVNAASKGRLTQGIQFKSTRRRKERQCFYSCRFGRSCCCRKPARRAGIPAPSGTRWASWPRLSSSSCSSCRHGRSVS